MKNMFLLRILHCQQRTNITVLITAQLFVRIPNSRRNRISSKRLRYISATGSSAEQWHRVYLHMALKPRSIRHQHVVEHLGITSLMMNRQQDHSCHISITWVELLTWLKLTVCTRTVLSSALISSNQIRLKIHCI